MKEWLLLNIHYPMQDWSAKNIYLQTKMVKINTLILTKMSEKPYPFMPIQPINGGRYSVNF